VDPDVLTAIAAACRSRERLRFRYLSHDGTRSDREAEPYQPVNWGRRWYLVAFDIGRPDWRTFRVESPAELAGHVRELADRYQRATR
jgi:predicted DNA-binding transcriptional regulator YafY